MPILNTKAWIMHIRGSVKMLHLTKTTRRLKEAPDQCIKNILETFLQDFIQSIFLSNSDRLLNNSITGFS